MELNENKLRYFPYTIFSASENMAFDHSVAKSFNENDSPIIRFYGWKPCAISTGYHQNFNDFNLEKINNDGFDITRRPTGGRAIFHANELTYSIIYPKSALTKFELYKKTHLAFSQVLKNFTSNVALSKKAVNFGEFYKEKHSAACFSASARFEVGIENKKLIGSAQRIYPNAILQHGSIMLSDDHLKLIDYLNINEDEKLRMKNEVASKTSFLDLNQFNLKIENLSERFLDCIVQELHFNSLETIDYNNFKIDLVAVE